MTDLFLIAHKVRGEPAFDIATQISCPICRSVDGDDSNYGCPECDQLGYWWIIPTSGHRAYPYWHTQLHIGNWPHLSVEQFFDGEMPDDWPDHYSHHSTPSRKLDLSALMPKAPIYRRT